jgi:dipeptide/tripeptide permease
MRGIPRRFLLIDVKTLRDGFSRTFWVANVIELFERFAYYGAKAILAIYLAESGAGPEVAGTLLGVFTYLLYFMPLLAGTIVDRYGFKKSLVVCFSIFCVGYSLLGLAGMAYGEQIVAVFGKLTYVSLVLLLTAIGGSLIKPCIVGTVARTTTPDTKSLGYSIYYMLVNIGGAIGPLLAVPVRESFGIEYVLLVSAGIVLASSDADLHRSRPAGRPPGLRAVSPTRARVHEPPLMSFC